MGNHSTTTRRTDGRRRLRAGLIAGLALTGAGISTGNAFATEQECPEQEHVEECSTECEAPKGELPEIPEFPGPDVIDPIVDVGNDDCPEGTDPEGTDPEGTDPEGTDPEGTDPEGTDPEGTDPIGTLPGGEMLPDLMGT